jgi:hypothetical protein
MGNLAEKLHGRFRIAIFQFAIGGTHAAERANLAISADRFPASRSGANFLEAPFPTFNEISASQVVTILVRKHTNRELTVGIDGAATVAAAAGVSLIGSGKVRLGSLPFNEPEVLLPASRIVKVQSYGLLRREANGQRALRAVDARIY